MVKKEKCSNTSKDDSATLPLPIEVDNLKPPLPPEVDEIPPPLPPEIATIPLPFTTEVNNQKACKSIQQSEISSSYVDSDKFARMNARLMYLSYTGNTLGITSEFLEEKYKSRLRNYQHDYSSLMQSKRHKSIYHEPKATQSFMLNNTIPLMSVDTSLPIGSCDLGSNVGTAIEELQAIVKHLQEKVDDHIKSTNDSGNYKVQSKNNVEKDECIETLQFIYLESVKCSDHTVLRSLIILLMTSMIKHMMLASPDFAELYGDFDLSFEGISRKTKRKEFCLRLILKLKDDKLEIVDVAKDPKYPYLGRIRKVERILPRGVDSKIYYVCYKDGYVYLSPQNIYSLLQSAVDKALESVSSCIEIDRHKYKVVRSVSKPLSLEIDTANIIDESVDINKSPIIRTEVSIFPEIKLDFSTLPIDFKPPLGEVRDRMMFLRRKLNSGELGSFSAVAYISAEEKRKFSLRFYESIEKAILNGKGSMNIIFQIIEHIRVRHFPVFSIELLKICMMWNALEKKNISNFWDMKKMEACFISSLSEILRRMDSGWIPDPIFVSNNLLPTLLQRYGLSEENFVPHALHYKDMENEKQKENNASSDTLKNLTSRGLSVLRDENIWNKQWDVEKQDVRQLRGLISARRWLKTRLERYHKNQNIRVFFL